MQFGTVNSATFEWIIPSYKELIRKSNRILSPEFHLLDSWWYLFVFSYKGFTHVGLCRRDSGAPKTITYTIKFNGRNDKDFIETATFERGNPRFGAGRMIYNTEWTSDSNIHISCYMTCDTRLSTPPHPVAERECLTCANQTEVPDCMSCANQTEDEDWSSLDRKGVALLSEHMKDLLNKSSDTDVTICVQGKEFRADRTILSTRSPVFAKMLAHDTGDINIEDCDPEFFNEFLLYVYSGRTENLTPSSALQLYCTADKYDFPVLKELCLSLLKTSLSVESICDVVHLAVKHQEKELLEVATEFFARNVKKILVTVAWQNFMSENPVEANELYIKSMNILLPEN